MISVSILEQMESTNREGLKVARFLMVLCSFSPLFLLWAVRGTRLIPDRYFAGACIALVILPNLFLWLRIRTAKKLNERRELVVGSADDHRDHLVVYLFVMLLPLYPIDLNSGRELTAAVAAVLFVVFIFWHLNLHYMNVLLAFVGYRVFSVTSPRDDNPLSGRTGFVLITKRPVLLPGERLTAYRVSDTVYLEG
jgi:hypothetical protein